MNRQLVRLSHPAIVIWCGMELSLAAHVGEASAQSSARKPPNIVFIFSDDHAYQAISAYNDPTPAD